jgi:phage/conjugal plasmid C-4 type zinc finger TraR family protein
MPDQFDMASEQEQNLRADALASHLRRVAAAGPPPGTESAEECERCSEPIPQARRLAVPGVGLCLQCQARIEKGFAR